MQDYINALFDGEQREMRLRRDLINSLEHALGGSAFDLLRRLIGGQWKRRDVEIVLEFACLSDQEADEIRHSPLRASLRFGRSVLGGSQKGRVSAFLDTVPIAPYSVLAARLLEAALYGIKPEDGVFHEGEELGEVA